MGPILLDRRRFMQLAAASGLAAAGAGVGWRSILAQADPSAGSAPGAAPVTDIVSAMAASLGHDFERIFRFVQEDVRYEPYAGILRGANGTLVARSGNAADQALLLAALLRASGIPVRFVSGAIDQAAADALMATTVFDAGAARDQALQSLLSDEDVATGIEWMVVDGVTPEELAGLTGLKDLRAALERDRQVLGPAASRHTQESIDIIQAALATAGVELPSDVTAMPPLEQEQHIWVQAQQDGDTWTDLDPSLADLPPGQPAATVAETMEVLPDELRHLVDFAVIAETFTGGTLVQEPILDAAFFADELAYRGVLFGHVPAEELQGLDQVNILGSGLSDGTAYNPLLVVGPQAIVGERSMSFGGSGGGGGLLGGFGGGGGEGLVEGETSAEWLDVGVSSPGREPVVARRAIFDRVGTAMRESGAIDPYAIPAAELVDLGDDVGAHFLPMRSVRAFSITGATPNARTLMQELATDDASAVALVPAMFDTTRALLGADVGASLASISFADTPAVTSLVIEPLASGTNTGIDVWHRPFGTLAVAGTAAQAGPALVAGVIPHSVERVMGGADQPVAPVISVGAVFEAAAAQGVPTRLLVDSLPADDQYDPDSRHLLRQALEAGMLVVIPERAVDLNGRQRLGWWLVDPGTGAAVDQMDDGGGQGIAQRAIMFAIGMLLLLAVDKYKYQILCLLGWDSEAVSTAMGRVNSGADPCGTSSERPPSGPRMQPRTPVSSGNPNLDKAQQQWQKKTAPPPRR